MDDMAIRDIEVVSEEGDGEEPSFVAYGNIGEALATDNLSDSALGLVGLTPAAPAVGAGTVDARGGTGAAPGVPTRPPSAASSTRALRAREA
jgi:hypothetical protein